MKKLITVTLILALLLPAAAMTDALPFRIVEHYTLLIDSHEVSQNAPFNSTVFTDFDSMTLDWYVASDGQTGYIMKTTCMAGVFFNHGIQKITRVDIGDKSYLVDDSGNHMNIMTDENGEVWIDFGLSYFRMQKVEHIDAYTDRQ